MRYVGAVIFNKELKKSDLERVLISSGSILYENSPLKNKLLWLVKGKQTLIIGITKKQLNDLILRAKYMLGKDLKKTFIQEDKVVVLYPRKEKEMVDKLELVVNDEIKKSIFKKRKNV